MTKQFYRNIIFTKTPLKTFLKVGDYFQIYPCDFVNAPKSDKHCHDFPLVIEYWVDKDEKRDVLLLFESFDEEKEFKSLQEHFSKSSVQITALTHLTRFLSVVTNHRFFQLSETEFKWGVAIPEGEWTEKEKEEINKSSSQPTMITFTYHEMWKDLQLTNFSEARHPYPRFLKHVDYYVNNPVEDRTSEITFSETIFQAVDKYFKLDTQTKGVIDAITHLICNGLDIKTKMRSMSFLSFVSAVETIVNFEFKDKREDVEFECHDCQTIKSSPIKCKKCGRPIWGVKAKFKAFLRTYISNSDTSIQKYNRIYNLRSDIVHNGMLLLGDEQFNWTKSSKMDSQYITHLEAMQLARLCLINWLLLGPNKKLITD